MDNYGISTDGLAKYGDEGFYRHIDFPNMVFAYSSFKREWVSKYINKNDNEIHTIFDIGAFEGGDSLRFSYWFPNSTIYTFEANPHNYSIMNRKFADKKPNIKIYQTAVSDKDGTIELYNLVFPMAAVGGGEGNSDYMMMSSINYSNQPLERKESCIVNSITFDTFCERNNIKSVDIAHIDVEGAGINVVAGMTKILPKIIFIEKERQDIFIEKPTGETELISNLITKDYELVMELDNDYLFVHNP